MKTEFKAVPVVGFKATDDVQGIVTTIVSVTGIEDEVKDVILPGAYAKTLVARTPKGVWSHTWETPVSKTITAEELLPGDSRLPKKQRNGEDWPKAAGGLLVETQFNMDTQRGREAFADVKFFAEEQEWSIGYSVPVGGAKIDPKTGVRFIKELDLFEYSPVLFGAMPLTSTVGVKSLADGDNGREPVREVQAAFKGAHVFKPSKDDEAICATCGHEEDYDEDDVFHKPADDGEKSTLEVIEEDGAFKAVEVFRDGTVTALDEEKTFETAEAAEGFIAEIVAYAKALDDEQEKPEGDKPDLSEDEPGSPGIEPGAADPAGDPGSGTPETTTGAEGDKPEDEAEDAPKSGSVSVETGEDGQIVIHASTEADPEEIASAVAAHLKALKVYAKAVGSYEERIDAVRTACTEWAKSFIPAIGSGFAYTWVWPEATFETRVLFCVYVETSSDYKQFLYVADYTYDEGSGIAAISEPVEAEVEAVIVEKALQRALDSKVGRTLSSANANTLVDVVSSLIGVLDAAGIEHGYTKVTKASGESTEEKEPVEGELVVLDFDLGATLEILKATAL